MTKVRTGHRCSECGAGAAQWTGRCPACGAWNTLVEAAAPAAGRVDGVVATRIDAPQAAAAAPIPTGIDEFDRVLGGGLVAGSVTLLGGEPGIGKSTLLLQAVASLARRGRRSLLVSAEESAQQVRLRAERLHALEPDLWLASETDLARITAAVGEVEPELAVIDSIQTIEDPALGSSPGSVGQVRGCAHALVELAKARGVAVVLVGHVTKDGSIAGPRTLEHVVDTVLAFEGERHHALRLLRAVKHRFGATGELGLFEMGEEGLRSVPDAGRLFLGDRDLTAPGSVVVPAIEGQRPLVVEVQALVGRDKPAHPRQSAQGLDASRLAMLVAVLDRRAGVSLGAHDIYASAVGGVRVVEPAADLAVALALASSGSDRRVPHDLVACGEVGLAGEVRQVGHTARRLAEAARLGFKRAIVPTSAPDGPAGLSLVRVATIAEALRAAGMNAAGAAT